MKDTWGRGAGAVDDEAEPWYALCIVARHGAGSTVAEQCCVLCNGYKMQRAIAQVASLLLAGQSGRHTAPQVQALSSDSPS